MSDNPLAQEEEEDPYAGEDPFLEDDDGEAITACVRGLAGYCFRSTCIALIVYSGNTTNTNNNNNPTKASKCWAYYYYFHYHHHHYYYCY
jgi:hypothetical protein